MGSFFFSSNAICLTEKNPDFLESLRDEVNRFTLHSSTVLLSSLLLLLFLQLSTSCRPQFFRPSARFLTLLHPI
jgi:hypothetical protein